MQRRALLILPLLLAPPAAARAERQVKSPKPSLPGLVDLKPDDDAILAARALRPVHVRIVTALGPIVLELRPDRAPITTRNFLRYLDRGLWNGASFYRTVGPKNDHNPAGISVIQGGLDKDDAPLGSIAHEPTVRTGLKHVDGAISMARGAPGTAGADFFICLGDNPALDFGGKRNPDGQGFAVFGKVVEGMAVVRSIHDRATQSASKDGYTAGQILEQPVRIVRVERDRAADAARNG